MRSKKDMPFASALEALFGGEEPPIHLLYRLTDMKDEDFAYFKRVWPAVHEERRRVLARHMADIVEEDFLVDFTPVFDYLFTDESAEVRQSALDGVWDSDDPRLIPLILAMLQNDASTSVRAAAARALAHFVLLSEWGQFDPAQAKPIVAALLAEYENPSTALEVRRATLEAMSSAAHPRIAELIDAAYEDGTEELQLSAIFAMGNSADERWLPILLEELSSPSPDFRAEAARACGMIGHADAVDDLETLVDDVEKEVGLAAIIALGQIGGDRALELLTRLSEDPDYDEFYDVIDDALEELEWGDSEFEMLSLAEDDDEFDLLDDDDLLLN